MTDAETAVAPTAERPKSKKSTSTAPKHVRSLDGIRFLAFFTVFVVHALQNNANPRVREVVAFGGMSVQVFFVMSGFLIGGILLEIRTLNEIPLRRRLGVFYARRALRIFPLYYGALLLCLALPSMGITVIGGQEEFLWNAAYLTNVRMYLGGFIGSLSHFWTLAVEEHFYLFIPLIMLTVSTKRLSIGFVVYWVLCALASAFFAARNDTKAELLSPMQFDCMTIGIAAAIMQRDGAFLGLSTKSGMKLAILCGVLLPPLFALRFAPYRPAFIAGQALEHWFFSVAVSGTLLFLWNAPDSRLARLLSANPMPYLGKISYGLYVFHLPCLVLASVWFSPYMRHGTAIPALIMTFLLAAASWHLMESPINDQKRRFPYA